MSEWAMVSGGDGYFQSMLEVARPHSLAYAEKWGMEYVEVPVTCSWDKVGFLLAYLDRYDGAFWLDADAVIVDDTFDIRRHLRDNAFGWVVHPIEGGVPNFGVVVMTKAARPFLMAMLARRGRYEDHPWWEQAAAMELMGYDPSPRAGKRYVGGSIFKAAELPLSWNVLFDRTPCAFPRIIHASGRHAPEVRIEAMKEAVRATKRAGVGAAQAVEHDETAQPDGGVSVP